GAGVNELFLWTNDYGNQFRLIGGVAGRALRNPAQNRFIVRAAWLQAHAATVRQRGARFLQDEASLGGGRKNAAASRLLRKSRIVEIGVERQQRKLKSVLTTRFPMAGALVAAASRQNRLNVELEAQRSRHTRCAVPALSRMNAAGDSQADEQRNQRKA